MYKSPIAAGEEEGQWILRPGGRPTFAPAEPVVTELVERLTVADRTSPELDSLLSEAADALQRLEAEKAQGIAMVNNIASMCSARDATIARLEAENRELLEDVKDSFGNTNAAIEDYNDALATITALQSELDRLRSYWPSHWASGADLNFG
jgi:chromosome segregation ATPase